MYCLFYFEVQVIDVFMKETCCTSLSKKNLIDNLMNTRRLWYLAFNGHYARSVALIVLKQVPIRIIELEMSLLILLVVGYREIAIHSFIGPQMHIFIVVLG